MKSTPKKRKLIEPAPTKPASLRKSTPKKLVTIEAKHAPKHAIDDLLEIIPDYLADWKDAIRWIETGKKIFEKEKPTQLNSHRIRAMSWTDFGGLSPKQPFGFYSSWKWRKFTLAVFLADLACYAAPVDQVSFERLLFLMHGFPQGFRVWWIKSVSGAWWPAGYTGWYPMLETCFNRFEKNPEKTQDRIVVPDLKYILGRQVNSLGPKNQKSIISQGRPYIYLFNYSVVQTLKKTDLSKTLIKRYANDILANDPAGLVSICVSQEGAQVAKKFGMTCLGSFKIEESIEDIYLKRFF